MYSIRCHWYLITLCFLFLKRKSHKIFIFSFFSFWNNLKQFTYTNKLRSFPIPVAFFARSLLITTAKGTNFKLQLFWWIRSYWSRPFRHSTNISGFARTTRSLTPQYQWHLWEWTLRFSDSDFLISTRRCHGYTWQMTNLIHADLRGSRATCQTFRLILCH